jgi:hypothetical protein
MSNNKIAALCVAALVLATGLVGCKKTPGYIGVFGPTLTADQKEQMKAEGLKYAAVAKAQGQKFDLNAEMKKIEKGMEKTRLTIKPEGTFLMAGVGPEMKGTWKAEENKISLTPDANPSSPSPSKSIVVTYDEKAQTLTLEDGGRKITFNKK